MKHWWEVNDSADISAWIPQTVCSASLHLLPKAPPRGTALLSTRAFLPTEKVLCSCPPLLRADWDNGTVSDALHSPPAACVLQAPTAVRGLPLSCTAFWYVSFSLTIWSSHKPQNPACWKIPLSGRGGNVRDCRGCSLKYKASFRVFIRVCIVVVSAHNQPGLLIPQLSACSCNKLLLLLFWIVEAQLQILFRVLSLN